MRFSVYQDSQIGSRSTNQDRLGYCFTRDALLLLLADGMGGHAEGDVAASLALQAMAALFQERAKPDVTDPSRLLDDLVFAAHHALHRYRAANRLNETPRTTVVIGLVQQDRAYWAHCGDSRLYWMRNGQILARTSDHSHVERLIQQGRLSPAARLTHPDRNKLFNCLGAPTLPRAEHGVPVLLKPGDQLLLCSDGLWTSIPDHELAYRLCARQLDKAIPELVRDATLAAGKNSDNVSALAMTWLGKPSAVNQTAAPPADRITGSLQGTP